MIFLTSLRRFSIAIGLTLLLTTVLTFGFTSKASTAGNTFTELNSQTQPSIQIAWGEGKAKAFNKNIEGKAQETFGNATGDPKNQMMGKAKQAQSQALNANENLKDKTKLTGRTKAIAKNLEGKTQEAKGNLTGDRQNQYEGKAKQAESQARNVGEDIKNVGEDIRDNIRNVFN